MKPKFHLHDPLTPAVPGHNDPPNDREMFLLNVLRDIDVTPEDAIRRVSAGPVEQGPNCVWCRVPTERPDGAVLPFRPKKGGAS